MDPLPTIRNSIHEGESGREVERPAAAAALRMRVWAYGGNHGKLRDLVWSGDEQVAELIRKVIDAGKGSIVAEYPSIVVAHFGDPIQTLATAKSLQQRLLTLYREPPTSQVVTAIIVDDQCGPEAATAGEAILLEANCAQILVSEHIYDLARNIPGFDLSPKPVREAGEGGSAEAFYEMRWTDESTYGHLRKTSRGSDANPSSERRYTIQSELGRGCMGVVYKAYDEVIGRAVALKTIVVNRSFPNHKELVERLKQEAKAAGSLDHPNIITIFDVGEEEDLVYLSMQLVEGKTLMALLAEGEMPPLSALLSYADQICSAVGFAHKKNVIHRDLKPANFMLTSDGVIKVLDFGIAKLEDATLTQTGMIVGTPTYMAPEQAKAKKIDQRSDIFSLGSVFYELFTREKPFKGDITTVLYKLIHEDPPPPSVINPALPIGIDAIIRKALAKEPEDRFQTCEEMREAFRQQAALLEASKTVKAVAPAPAQSRTVTVEDLLEEVRPKRSRSRSRIWIGLAAVVVLAAVGLGTWAFGVKAKTGSFPPALTKVLTLVLPAKTQANTDRYSGAGQQPSFQSSSAAAADTGTNTSQTANSNQPAPNGAQPANSSEQPATGEATPASASDDTKGQAGSDRQSAATAPDTTERTEANPFEPHRRSQKTSAPEAADSTLKDSSIQVAGFSRRDIPDLLNRANDAAGRGDYRQARYVYGIILRLDHGNDAARTGLKRVIDTEQEH